MGRWWVILSGVGCWWACSGPKPDDTAPDSGGGQAGAGGFVASGGSAQGGASGDASSGNGGTLGGGNAGAGAVDDGNGGASGGAGVAGATDGGAAGGGGTGAVDAGDAGDAGPCAPGCPDEKPACRDGVCRGIIHIATGTDHTCAVFDDKTVSCWGDNGVGQLGTADQIRRGRPQPTLVGLTDVARISAGSAHSCAVTGSGAVSCWGQNTHGQLGRPGHDPAPAPVQNLQRPVLQVGCNGDSIASGPGGYSCALVEGGTVQCWGVNAMGQLGNGESIPSSVAPTEVKLPPSTRVAQIAVGFTSACALTSSKQVYCWGDNRNGRLATDSDSPFLRVPEVVRNLDDARMIDAGEHHFCAVVGDDGRVKCWGSDSQGQLGDGPVGGGISDVVVDVPVNGVIEVHTGTHTTCALLYSRYIRCWGGNASGEFGNGTRTSRNTINTLDPETILPARTEQLSFRAATGCALLTTGPVWCWGINYGNIGNGLIMGSPVIKPEPVLW